MEGLLLLGSVVVVLSLVSFMNIPGYLFTVNANGSTPFS